MPEKDTYRRFEIHSSAYGAGCMVRVTGLAVETGGTVNTERETECGCQMQFRANFTYLTIMQIKSGFAA